MVAKRERPEREQADIDASRIGAGPGTQDLADDKINAAEPAFRPLPSGRPFSDQPASREPTVAWRVAASHAIHHQSANDEGIAPVRRRRNGGILLSVFFAVGIIIGVLTTSVLAPDRSQSFRILADAARGAASTINLHQVWPGLARTADRMAAPLSTSLERVGHASKPTDSAANETGGDARSYTGSEQLAAEIQQAKDALQTAPAVSTSIIVGDDDAPDTKTGGSGWSEATAPSRSVQMPTVSGRAAASVIEETTEVNARGSPPENSAAPSEQASRSPLQPLPSSVQGAQPASDKARLRQQFEQFLKERQLAPVGPQDREALLVEFKKFVEFRNSQANVIAREGAPISTGSTRRVQIWQALDTTNLRELASSSSAVIGEVVKGSTFRVIDRSEDRKWLRIETRDGSTGYYWAARAREMR
jgi:hypothetical protein